jgi:hypothetical protein
MRVDLNARVFPRLGRIDVDGGALLPPGVRGYWTDEELLADARLSSLPMLKKLQAMGWVQPGHVPVEGGGRRRAWLFQDAMKVALVAEIAQRSDLAVLAVAALLHRAPSEWIRSAAGLDRRTHFANTGEELVVGVERGARIAILDMSEAWLERSPGEFELLSTGVSLSGRDIKVPANRETRRQLLKEGALVGGRSVTLILNLAAVSLSFVGVVAEMRATQAGRPSRS